MAPGGRQGFDKQAVSCLTKTANNLTWTLSAVETSGNAAPLKRYMQPTLIGVMHEVDGKS